MDHGAGGSHVIHGQKVVSQKYGPALGGGLEFSTGRPSAFDPRNYTQTQNWSGWGLHSLKTAVDLIAPASLSTPPNPNKDTILYAQFQQVSLFPNQPAIQYLLVGYDRGFQIWDVYSMHDKVVELASSSLFRVSMLTILETPEPESDQWHDKRPIVALASAEENSREYPSRGVFFYSLAENKIIHEFRFPDSVVTDIASNSQYIVVGTKTGAMHILDAQTFKPVESFSGLPHPEYGAVFTLGPRWLAFQSTLPLLDSAAISSKGDSAEKDDNGAAIMQYYRNLLQTTTSKDLLDMTNQGIMNAMWYGTKTVQRLYSGSSAPSTPPMPSMTASQRSRVIENATPGVVQIMDLATGILISHFKAESEPMTKLSFDPSGTLLVTCRDSGQELQVWKISPGNPIEAHTKYYTLVRGVSLNQVRDVCWSHDSLLVGITSRTNGTTHVFPVSLNGSEVSYSTHITKQLSIDFKQPTTITAPAKLGTIHSDRTAAKNQFAGTASMIPHSSYHKLHTTMIYHFNVEGSLIRNDMLLERSEVSGGQITAKLLPKCKWDLGRTKDWTDSPFNKAELEKQFEGQIAAPPSESDTQAYSQWLLANAEIHTCEIGDKKAPFWKASQFSLSAWSQKPPEIAYDVGNPSKSKEKQAKKGQTLLENDEIYQMPTKSLKVDAFGPNRNGAAAAAPNAEPDGRRGVGRPKQKHAAPVLKPEEPPVVAIPPQPKPPALDPNDISRSALLLDALNPK